MRRRDLLALSGPFVAGLAGCLSPFEAESEAGPRTSDQSTTDTATTTTDERSFATDSDSATEPDSTTPSVADASVSVSTDALQPGVVTMTTPDSIGVGRDDGQYLLLDVSADGEVLPSRDDFSFLFAGRTHQPVVPEYPWRIWRAYNEEDWAYDGSGDGILLFELPESAGSDSSSSSEEAVLTWPGGEWTPDESVRQRLVTPHPPLSVSFEVSEEIPTFESPTVTVTVRNDGDVPGRFVAGLNRSGPSVAHTPVERISFLVPAGETETWELTDDSIVLGNHVEERVGNGESDMTYYLSWADDSVRRDVRYVE